jgi:hypothetical protein
MVTSQEVLSQNSKKLSRDIANISVRNMKKYITDRARRYRKILSRKNKKWYVYLVSQATYGSIEVIFL